MSYIAFVSSLVFSVIITYSLLWCPSIVLNLSSYIKHIWKFPVVGASFWGLLTPSYHLVQISSLHLTLVSPLAVNPLNILDLFAEVHPLFPAMSCFHFSLADYTISLKHLLVLFHQKVIFVDSLPWFPWHSDSNRLIAWLRATLTLELVRSWEGTVSNNGSEFSSLSYECMPCMLPTVFQEPWIPIVHQGELCHTSYCFRFPLFFASIVNFLPVLLGIILLPMNYFH